MPLGRRLIVVSNRLPLSIRGCGDEWRAERSSGGLATAMDPVLAGNDGLWFGWPGESDGIGNRRRQVLLERWRLSKGYAAVELPAEVARQHYEGFANRTLWPLFHHFPSRVSFDPEGWRAYVDANKRFADAVAGELRAGDLVWVHDYHLLLLPQLLREAAPQASIGFFLHIPFPSSEVFRVLPRREELLKGVLGADLVAFQTHSHLQHFRTSLLRILGLESRMDQVDTGGHAVRLEALPIGIAPSEFTGPLDSEPAIAHRAELDRRFRDRRILLAVDRLDYTKGIPERLRTYRRLLETTPELRKSVVLIQIAVPSRERIACYAELKREVNELVGDINGDFGTADWTPVVYIRRNVPRAELVALYSAAEVGWVTPLRDGMNLVAKEYVACKCGRAGSLVLSEFAGAAEEMGEAFAVNPYDEERTAAVLARVLSLPHQERRERMAALYARVLRNDVFAWSERFLAQLRAAGAEREARAASRTSALDVPAVLQAYRDARERLLFLDYDGTLVSFSPRPEAAVPPPELVELLSRLSADPANHVVLVSGRRRTDLENWFGAVERLCLAAEHGGLVRRPHDRSWQPLRPPAAPNWKTGIRAILEHFVDRTPGSLIEEKEYSLVWHYRMADPEFGEWLANELVSMLEGMLAETELRALRGNKVVEVRPSWMNKGAVASQLMAEYPAADFILAAGDDATDEDLFAALPTDAWTIRIGPGETRAKFGLRNAGAVRRLLESFHHSAAAAA